MGMGFDFGIGIGNTIINPIPTLTLPLIGREIHRKQPVVAHQRN